ncbi:hypothetical protein I553_9701 [Mycobacterium xenopi 4042]|uniref:UvrABC system protein A n=1 Tax=Mycobacterium xenopi 4042 TaxID=1299334 RepID=X7YQG6_MYCXE|nr:hypothetical protein I553_9701 [Mycobacterium xenopi 4042]
MADRLIVKGAREHNLRSVDLDLPRDALIVFTGLSGSGKSSLAFDTIFAEGSGATWNRCRRMPASSWVRWTSPTSTSSKGCPGGVHRPEVDQPQPALDGRNDHRGLRLSAAAVRPRRHTALPGVRRADRRQTPQQIVDQVLAMPEGRGSRCWPGGAHPQG